MKLTKLFAPALCAIVFQSAIAELPPSVYEKMQTEATDVLRVSVLEVEKTATDDPHVTDIRLVVDVLKVGRSSLKVRPGDVITITYRVTERKAPWVGPGEVPVLEIGDEVPAFLKPIEGTSEFAPAAGVMSFRTFRDQ